MIYLDLFIKGQVKEVVLGFKSVNILLLSVLSLEMRWVNNRSLVF